ncbi:MAG: hypothetical protein QF491_09095, partial [Alphaproteobacteria bacterium]|nr:hypothetical protein [Alphaproteobacteria bacterium]
MVRGLAEQPHSQPIWREAPVGAVEVIWRYVDARQQIGAQAPSFERRQAALGGEDQAMSKSAGDVQAFRRIASMGESDCHGRLVDIGEPIL